MQEHMRQNIIPANINNHMNIAISSAHVTPAGSAIHSPLASGPASAPLATADQAFDMRALDPMSQMETELRPLDVNQEQMPPHEMQMNHAQLSAHGMNHGQLDPRNMNAEQLRDAMTQPQMHDTMHAMVNPMESTMHMQNFGDLDGMAMGNAQLHGMTDNSHLGNVDQHMGDQHMRSLFDGMISRADEHGDIESFNPDTMMLDGNMDLKPSNMG